MSHIEKGEIAPSVTARTPQEAFGKAPPRRFGNPGPLGLFSFASTTLILSLFNCSVRDIHTPNVVVGQAIFVGGLAQLLAGMWEFAVGNTFGATAFTSFGGFWLSYASIFIPGSGILAAYESTTELESTLGIYLMAWFVLTFILLIAATRRNIGLIVLFFFLTVTFMLLAISEFQASVTIKKAGGALGVVTAIIAYYVGTAELLTREDSFFTLPLGVIPKRVD